MLSKERVVLSQKTDYDRHIIPERRLKYRESDGTAVLKEEFEIVRISVRNLVEFILREGDIDNRHSGSLEKEAMLLGGRIHRKIQKNMGPDYRAEVSLKMQVPCTGFSVLVEGRADGIIEEITGSGAEDGEKKVTVDEIKGVLRNLELIRKPENIHLAQAKCYAYIYAKQQQLSEISVRLTYCSLETEEIKRFTETYDTDTLQKWFDELIGQYEKWARFQLEWRRARNLSAREIRFPFSYRAGQKEVAAAVYRTILRKKKLFVQAPTGVGKTISTVFPAVKAIGEELGERIFYLTAKTITRTVAEQAFGILAEQKLRMKVITLTAKEKICFCDETDCNPDSCSFARGHYDRVNDAVYDLLVHENRLDRKTIEKQARKYEVCPFELSLDLASWSDAVICDYNYVFDPNARLKRFFSEGNAAENIFLIDEAHNLVDRGREMYSAALYKEEFLETRKLLRNREGKLAKRLGELNRLFLVLKRDCEKYQVLDSVSHIALKLMSLMTETEDFLEECEDENVKKKVREFYFKVRAFVNIHDILDENYVIYSELEESGAFKIKLFCVNPAVNLAECLSYGTGTVFFSATLLPVRYYMKLLSVEPDDYTIYAESSFPSENRLVLLGADVSTKYTRRGREMYDRYAAYIAQTARSKTGNYMAFFPSYRMMEDILECFVPRAEGIDYAVQEQYMSETDREEFLEAFEKERENSFVGFCIMGGIFSEGIDLAEDRLIGAIIVGTGLPQVCNDRELIRNYFNEHSESGFDYAYLYPGMNKVLQAAGRVIRTEKDKGVILLLDDRFSSRRYQEIFPREWNRCFYCNAESLPDYIEAFWK